MVRRGETSAKAEVGGMGVEAKQCGRKDWPTLRGGHWGQRWSKTQTGRKERADQGDHIGQSSEG